MPEQLTADLNIIRQILDNLPERAYVKDRQHRYLCANEVLAADLNVHTGDMVGKTEKDFFEEAFARRLMEEEKRVWETQEPVNTEETVTLRGRERSFNLCKTLLLSDDGAAVALLGIMSDITERVASERELQRVRDQHEEMVYVVSHDLQEPLRMIVGFSELLAQRYGAQLDEKAEHYIGYAVDGARRMQKMIGDLLAYSRIVSRGGPFEPVGCSGIVAEVLGELQREVEAEHATVTVRDLPEVYADPEQLRVVFHHLIKNALTFRKENPPDIEVSGRTGESRAEITVSDNGIGIDPKHHDRIFVIFQRLHSRDEYPGRGAGLALAKRIVERHGGSIAVASMPGKGAHFTFSLPVPNQSRPTHHAEEHQHPAR